MWSVSSGRQKYEFLSPHDAPCTVTYHPSEQTIACGFDSGFIRVFDVVSTSTKHELEQHTGMVKCLLYNAEGTVLYSAATDGHISMFDVAQEYMPLKTVACDVPADGVMLCLSSDGTQLAAPGPEKNAITMYDSATLIPGKKMVYKRGEDISECPFQYISFYSRGSIVAFTDSRAVYFKNGKVVSDLLPAQGSLCFAKSSSCRFYACASAKASGDLSSNFVYLWRFGGETGKKVRACEPLLVSCACSFVKYLPTSKP